MNAPIAASSRLVRSGQLIIGRFHAMGCPCEVLMDTDEADLAKALFAEAEKETLRIESQFSRYGVGNIVHRINSSGGRAVELDQETAHLIDFADQCHRMSGGLFDITSGVLRKAWRFDGSGRLPTEEAVRQLLPFIGWKKVSWHRPFLFLQSGMEIDLGGIGKEYAVDRTVKLLREKTDIGFLVNYGGDIAASGPRRGGEPWSVGIEGVDQDGLAVRIIKMKQGALATSGDSKKFVLKNGTRYGHILDPRTGYSVQQAPRSVTVAADTCSEAGFLSTMGMLKGEAAEEFLRSVGARFWCFRG